MLHSAAKMCAIENNVIEQNYGGNKWGIHSDTHHITKY